VRRAVSTCNRPVSRARAPAPATTNRASTRDSRGCRNRAPCSWDRVVTSDARSAGARVSSARPVPALDSTAVNLVNDKPQRTRSETTLLSASRGRVRGLLFCSPGDKPSPRIVFYELHDPARCVSSLMRRPRGSTEPRPAIRSLRAFAFYGHELFGQPPIIGNPARPASDTTVPLADSATAYQIAIYTPLVGGLASRCSVSTRAMHRLVVDQLARRNDLPAGRDHGLLTRSTTSRSSEPRTGRPSLAASRALARSRDGPRSAVDFILSCRGDRCDSAPSPAFGSYRADNARGVAAAVLVGRRGAGLASTVYGAAARRSVLPQNVRAAIPRWGGHAGLPGRRCGASITRAR